MLGQMTGPDEDAIVRCICCPSRRGVSKSRHLPRRRDKCQHGQHLSARGCYLPNCGASIRHRLEQPAIYSPTRLWPKASTQTTKLRSAMSHMSHRYNLMLIDALYHTRDRGTANILLHSQRPQNLAVAGLAPVLHREPSTTRSEATSGIRYPAAHVDFARLTGATCCFTTSVGGLCQ